jgi:DNA translocase FtsK/SpoIIIE-like protein
MEETSERTVQMPVDKLSYSGMTQLLRDPLIFKVKYILGVFDTKMGQSGMVGRAGHEALKAYYGGNKDIAMPTDPAEAQAMAIDIGMQYLVDFDDAYIDYGKTGSRESMLKNYAQAMRFYFAEEPTYHEILLCEEKMESIIKTVDGQELPLPAVAIPDIVHKRQDGGIEIVDVKFVKTFTEYTEEDWIKIVQSQFLWHVLRGAKNLTADRMLFREVKVTENARENAGKPQIRDWAVPFSHEQYRIFFYNLYRDVTKFLSNPDAIYLPNLSDPFDGEQAGFLYTQGLISGDMSDVEVMHKVRDIAFTSKRFVSSRLDSDVNKHLLPEEKIKLRLAEFGIPVEPIDTIDGTSVTQYRFKVSAGIPMARFAKHKADIARAIEAKGEIRILAPIPGTSYVGIEIPKETTTKVMLEKRHLVPDTLSLPIGMTVDGSLRSALLNEMPHLLIAGTTGSGKSSIIDTYLTALTKQNKPKDMQLMLIDPKRVELAKWADDKHLKGGKIAYEYDDAMLILNGLSGEMERRYKLLEIAKVKDIDAYNKKMPLNAIPKIVLVVDEFADLILQGKVEARKKKKRDSLETAALREKTIQMSRQFAKMGMDFKVQITDDDSKTAEELIARLAAMARATGIHLIIATQRPSVDVVTGIIKANFPTRIALMTASPADSKVILGVEGAEKLNGKGDMLFMHAGAGIVRLQGLMSE